MEKGSEPSAIYVGELPDMAEVMVTVWADGSAECAFREDEHSSWGRPIPMEPRPVRI